LKICVAENASSDASRAQARLAEDSSPGPEMRGDHIADGTVGLDPSLRSG
jgi:hypothetical protein